MKVPYYYPYKHKRDKRMKRLQNDQRGMAHIGLVLLAVAVIGAIGFVGWRVVGKNKTPAASVQNAAATAAAQAECKKENDKDICKFYASWKLRRQYSITSTDAGGTKSIFEIDGDNSHMSVTGETPYDVITIGKTTYTKAGDVWYKQTIKDATQEVTKDIKPELSEPKKDNDSPAAKDKTVYKKIGKEACGKLTCFKYQVLDPSVETSESTYIWFDDKDYQLRRSITENKEGVSEQIYAYDNVSIKAPSPVKELGPDEYIVPGQSTPVTLPSAADYNVPESE